MPDACFIIAEAGVNHNGNLDAAKALADAALDVGADAVKYQLFDPAALVVASLPMADYQTRNLQLHSSQLEMLTHLALAPAAHAELQHYCRSIGIRYLCSPFDMHSARFLIEHMQLDLIKIGSGELTNAPMLYDIAHRGVGVLLSTGMATLDEIQTALGILTLGYLKLSPLDFDSIRIRQLVPSDRANAVLRDKVQLLQCTSNYPCPPIDINLRSMDTLCAFFQLPVGLSDHSDGISIAIAAVARGARVIEKHFTLDRNQSGPDHLASIEPNPFREMVRAIREVELALGSPNKGPTASEQQTKKVVRKHLVAATAIQRGEKFTAQNIVCKRSEHGLDPILYWQTLGMVARRSYQADEPLECRLEDS